MLALDHTRARPPRATSRVQAALTALAFVLASLIGLVHEATTRHVRCAEHGELIHGNATAANTADPARDTVVRELPAAASHDHEHCSLTSAMRESRVVPRAPVIVPVTVPIGELAVALPRVVAARGGGLFRTAPKTSPPA